MALNNALIDNFEDDVYGVLVLSPSESKSTDLIKQILGTDDLPPAKRFHEKVIGYPWHIETKYYVADVYLFVLLEKDLINVGFAESVQGVVIYFDSGDRKGFEYAKSWLPFVENYDAEVMIVVCENCSEDTVIAKPLVLDWCLRHHFELVELCPTEENDDDDFKETTGCKRIVQALYAHTWPNLCMKDSETFPSFEGLRANLEDSDNVENALRESEQDDQFGNLLSSLNLMKERAACLDGNERKRYAEHVAVAFWRAMGGDEDEIAGLSGDEEGNDAHDNTNSSKPVIEK